MSQLVCRFDNFGGLDENGRPVTTVPKNVLDSIRKNRVCLKGTLFTPLRLTTATESLNVQMRKSLDSHINLVHGFSLKGLPPGVIRHHDIDIVVIRCAHQPHSMPICALPACNQCIHTSRDCHDQMVCHSTCYFALLFRQAILCQGTTSNSCNNLDDAVASAQHSSSCKCQSVAVSPI